MIVPPLTRGDYRGVRTGLPNPPPPNPLLVQGGGIFATRCHQKCRNTAGLQLDCLSLSGPIQQEQQEGDFGGGGIGGLCCAYELMKRGHEVTVLEASGRTGGHVLTLRDHLADGLYVDAGAEHFTKPGYDRYWQYVKEFELPYLAYPRRPNVNRFINGRMYTPEMLADRNILKSFGFNQREIDFLANHQWWEFQLLYFKPYLDNFENEYRPFDAKLDSMDQITVTDLLRKDGASDGAIGFIGGSSSALQALWHTAILKLRGVPIWPPQVFRIKGGNQKMTDAFAARLGERVRLGCPVTAIEHGETGVTVSYREFGGAKKIEADYLVSCMSLVQLRKIPVAPDWPEEKDYVIRNTQYYSISRPIFQSRTRFWEKDKVSPNLEFDEAALESVWRMADEVPTSPRTFGRFSRGQCRCRRVLGNVSQILSRQVRRHRAGKDCLVAFGSVGFGL